VLIKLSDLGGIEFGSLENLDLSDSDRLEGEDVTSVFLNLLVVIFREEVLGELSDVVLRSLRGDESVNLSADSSDLRSLGIRSCFDVFLSVSSLGEGESEDSDNVTVIGLAIDSRLNEGLPLSDHGAESVSGDIESVEGGLSVSAFDFINYELHLSPELVSGVILEVSKSRFDDSSLDLI
jgi:hypothetical protein